MPDDKPLVAVAEVEATPIKAPAEPVALARAESPSVGRICSAVMDRLPVVMEPPAYALTVGAVVADALDTPTAKPPAATPKA